MDVFRRLVVLAAIVSLAGCSEELPPPEPDRQTIGVERFGAVLSDLVVARIEVMPDTAAYDRRLEEILQRHDVSREELRGFVQAHGQNDDLITGAYARVDARLDSLYPTGQAAAGIDSLLGAVGTADTVTSAP